MHTDRAADDIFHSLRKNGVLSVTADSVGVSSEFWDRIEEYVSVLESDGANTASTVDLADHDDGDPTRGDSYDRPPPVDDLTDLMRQAERASDLLARSERDPEFLARYLALEECFPTVPYQTLLRYLSVLSLARTPERIEGVPTSFVPVRGDELPHLLRIFRYAVVYLWRDDCPPCDLVVESLDELFDGDENREIGLFGVYGPHWATSLYDSVDAVGAPTLLFVRENCVDSRLHGAHRREIIEREIEVLRSYE